MENNFMRVDEVMKELAISKITRIQANAIVKQIA